MKRIVVFFAFSLLGFSKGFSQMLNWRNLKKDQRHIVNIHSGIEHGLIFGVGYGYRLNSKLPIVLNATYSFPGGEFIFDDFKTMVGGQVKFYQVGSFLFSGAFHGIFRRYENDFATLLNFGTDFSLAVGYYKPKWYAGIEGSFDKAIVTHFKHTNSYRELYPLVKNGWYEPPTGGNFYYGLQTGFSVKNVEIYLRLGKIVAQDFQTKPILPFSIQ